MNLDQSLLLSIVFVPVIGAFVLPLVGCLSERLRNLLALILVSTSFLFSASLIPSVLSRQAITFHREFLMGFNLSFTADPLAVGMAIVSSLVGSIIVLYSFGYIGHYDNRNEYYLTVVLFLGSMMGIIFSSNLILLFVFWELTAICSWRLVGFFRGKNDVLRADKTFLVTVFGALVMLIGFIMLYSQTGSFDLSAIKQALQARPISDLAMLLILVGIFSKSATLPFHTWLPDAGVAPSPVTALLHAAVLVKIGVYVFARLFVATFPINELWHTLVPAVAAASAILAAGAALIETDLKRLIAYSTISQIGFIFLGLATGNLIGIAGGLLYILMHGIAKAGLFLCAGIVEQNTKTKDITKLGGLIHTMPLTGLSFLFCSFSVMGIPPFGGFFSKLMVFIGSVRGQNPAITAAFLFGAFLTIIYLLRVFNLVFLGDTRINAKEGSATMVFSVVTLAILSLAAGLFISYPSHFAQVAVQQMLGAIK
jgi:proton-translocating NADH-quinone oxidoreductase chain N